MGSIVLASGQEQILEVLSGDVICEETRRALVAVAAVAPTVRATMLSADGTYGPELMCLRASRLARNLLADRGVSFDVMAGDVVIAPRHTLEHHVLVRQHSTELVVVDFTASQLPWFTEDPVVGVVANPQALLELVAAEWRWFIGS